MANMAARQPRTLIRRPSNNEYASSASTSPERRPDDDDNDSIMLQPNDSLSSLSCSDPDDVTESAQREMEERWRVSPISRLPAELMISIFQKLPKTSDLASCMLVSRDWAANSVALLWHRPTTQNWNSLHAVVKTLRSGSATFDYSHLVKRLNLSNLGPQVSDGTLLPFQNCNRIERLTLTACNRLTDLSVAKVIEGNRSLAALDVTNIHELSDLTMNAVAKNCYRLQGLNITNCQGITNDALEAVASSCRLLKRIKLTGCNQVTEQSVIAFARNCRQLLEIDLADCRRLEDDAVTAVLSESVQLRELRLSRCIRLTDQAFLNLPYGQTYDHLRILDLTDCIELQDAAVHRIIEAAPRLRNLVLAKCRQITDRAISAITRLGKNLHYIHLGHCSRLTDAGVLLLVRLCNRIRYIDLACCTHLTDDSITHLATLPKLKRIGLVKCSNITDTSILALAKPRQPGHPPGSPGSGAPSALERVHLSYCINLTLHGITALLNNCPRLSHLSLTGVQAFLREDLILFCRPPPDEFNDHQRDVFCVFSGTGVGRLRDYLMHQAHNENLVDPDVQATMFGADDTSDDADTSMQRNLFPPPPPPPPHHGVAQPLGLPFHPPAFPNLTALAQFAPQSTAPAQATPGPGLRQLGLPQLRIPPTPQPGPNGTPPAVSPTHDAPLSVDDDE